MSVNYKALKRVGKILVECQHCLLLTTALHTSMRTCVVTVVLTMLSRNVLVSVNR